MNKPNDKVIIHVSGGVAHMVRKPKHITVEVWDYDVDGADGDDARLKVDGDGDQYRLATYE